MSDSDSSIYNGENTKTSKKAVSKDTNIKNTNAKSKSQTNRLSKSRKSKQIENKHSISDNPNSNSIIQEGVRVLFQKNKQFNDIPSKSPFHS